MSSIIDVYNWQENVSDNGIRFVFISSGEKNIVKAVQFVYIQNLMGRRVYNLGFGDYDFSNARILDDVNTNNGDVYKVFNTVLGTIQAFFETYESDIIMVEGSDSRPEFIEHCRINCKKKCQVECKNFNRRINVYRSYIDKHYNKLITDFQFFGGCKGESITELEDYITGKKYDAVFLLKRNV